MHDLWGIHLYLYAGTLRIGGNALDFRNGYLSITPPNTLLEWCFPDHAPHYYAHLSFPADADRREVPVLLGPLDWLEEGVSGFEYIASSYVREPIGAKARIWSIIWRSIADYRKREERPVEKESPPSTVQIAISIIDQTLSDKIRVSHLAQRVGVSHNHLITLFRRTFGTTVAAYIRKRRCQRARFLLENTSLSVKSIAREVGLPDLHHFNKTIRSEFGVAPRVLRKQLVQDQTKG